MKNPAITSDRSGPQVVGNQPQANLLAKDLAFSTRVIEFASLSLGKMSENIELSLTDCSLDNLLVSCWLNKVANRRELVLTRTNPLD